MIYTTSDKLTPKQQEALESYDELQASLEALSHKLEALNRRGFSVAERAQVMRPQVSMIGSLLAMASTEYTSIRKSDQWSSLNKQDSINSLDLGRKRAR